MATPAPLIAPARGAFLSPAERSAAIDKYRFGILTARNTVVRGNLIAKMNDTTCNHTFGHNEMEYFTAVGANQVAADLKESSWMARITAAQHTHDIKCRDEKKQLMCSYYIDSGRVYGDAPVPYWILSDLQPDMVATHIPLVEVLAVSSALSPAASASGEGNTTDTGDAKVGSK